MKIFKSHFWYNKSQRNGILFLVLIILILQFFIFADIFSGDEIVDTDTPELRAFQRQIDSLKKIEIENVKPKIFPFNPNYISDYKGEQLGLSLQEVDRLLAFRKTGKFVNSKKEFQQVTKVSDSLLNTIAPYFKFPDWVIKRNQRISKQNQNRVEGGQDVSKDLNSYKISTLDLNKATQQDFMFIAGIDEQLSNRIVNYRSKLQGFSFENQLYEVFNISPDQVKSILKKLHVLEKPNIKKLNVNTVEFKQLLKNPYIDYELCKKIFDYRDEVAELQNITELKNIKGFPLEKYNRIVLYLLAE